MSNRLTFSLASLILLFALGFVFGTNSVMAHDPVTGLVVIDHPHPLNMAQGDNPNTPGVTEPTVNAHSGHPMVTSIMLKEADNTRGNMAAVSGTNVGTTDVFTLVITFDSALTEVNTETTPSANSPLVSAEIPAVILNKDKVSVATDGVNNATVTVADATRVADSMGKQFEAVVTIGGSFPSGNDADAHGMMYVRVGVNPAAGFGLATRPDQNVVNGGANLAVPSSYEFVLVNALPTITSPMAPGPPTNLMADANNERGTITLSWDAPANAGTSAITGYTVTKTYNMSDGTVATPKRINAGTATMITIPGSNDPALPTDTKFMFTVTATSADGTSVPSNEVMAMIDNAGPMVMITAPSMVNSAGKLVFVVKVSEELGSGANDLELGDFTITGDVMAERALGARTMNTGADSNDYPYMYDLTVMPDANMSVTVTLTGDVRDLSNNKVDMTTPIMATYDVTPPMYVSSAFAINATNASHLDVTLVFNEDVVATSIDITPITAGVRRLTVAKPVAGADHTYMVTVAAPGHATRQKTDMFLAAGVRDMAGNATLTGTDLHYTSPEVTAPTVAITANPDPINCDMGSTISFAIAGSSETLVLGDITISAGWKVGADNDPSDGTLSIVPDGNNAIGVTTVDIGVKANVVGKNAAKTMTFTVGPVLTIPAGGYIVVIRPEHKDVTHLGDPLYLGHTGVRAPRIIPQHWECMPDLTVFFGRTVPSIGGGALVVKEADGPMGHDPGGTLADIGKGTVGITEIMWASDEGVAHGGTPLVGRSNVDQTREQWIELHNRNTTAVKVTLFARPTGAALVTENDEIDRVSNYNIDNVWEAKGQNGNSARGIDFVSMKRAQVNDKNYNLGDVSGTNADKWSASTLSYNQRESLLANTGVLLAENLTYDFRGTPGRSNAPSVSTPTTRKLVPKDSIVFNEIANRRDQTLEWIELKNVSDKEVNLKKYQISLATRKGTDHAFYTFPDNDNIKLKAGEILLLLDTDPRDNDSHPIAVAFNRDDGNDQGLGIGPDAIKYKVANFREGGLPDDGNFALYLRNRNDRLKSHEGVIDVIGWSDKLADAAIHTKYWPLVVFDGRRWEKGGLDARNKIAVETVHRRQHLIDPDQNTHKDDKDEHQALRDVGYTGIGYKRHAQRIAAHGGTPGYADTRKNLVADVTAATGALTISEIMYDQGDGRYPQWIEIYNSSDVPVNLHSEAGWRLVIENFDDGEIAIETLSGTLNFKKSDVQTILPNQTVMVTSTRARNSGSAFFDTRVIFPATRVFSVWDDQRGELTKQPDKGGRPSDPILSTEGFYIELIDGKGNVSDGVGNLVPSPNRRVAHNKVWELSDIYGGMMEDDGRSSILRRYRTATQMRYSDTEILDMGITAAGWISAHITDFLDVRETWYGHQDDVGSPGITGGRVLPVSLSKFRPERLESGAVVIRWITESETNNAGFNILRSEKSDGEFTKINTKLIAGQGTTSERTVYTHTDTSAKPNVVYYYQIQDISLDGKVQTLRMSRLKGHVSAAGKATTTWGELKALQ